MSIRIALLSVGVLGLAACQEDLESREQDVVEAQQEVRKARTEGARDVREAREEGRENVAEEQQQAALDVSDARAELQKELTELHETMAEMRQDPNLSAEERARLAEYEQRYSLMDTRVRGAGEHSDWSLLRIDVQQLGDEFEGWRRDATAN